MIGQPRKFIFLLLVLLLLSLILCKKLDIATLETRLIQNAIFINLYHETFLLKHIIYMSVVIIANLPGDEC